MRGWGGSGGRHCHTHASRGARWLASWPPRPPAPALPVHFAARVERLPERASGDKLHYQQDLRAQHAGAWARGRGGGGGDDARCRRGGGWPRSSGRHVPLTAKSVGSGARTRPRPHALRNCTRHSCWHCRRMSDSLTSASVPDFAASSRLSTLMATGVPSGSSPSYTWGGGGPGRSREGLVRGGAARGTAT